MRWPTRRRPEARPRAAGLRKGEEIRMPFIQVNLTAGRSPAQKREFTEAVTREAARILNCPPEVVWIVFNDVAKEDWATGGVLVSEQT